MTLPSRKVSAFALIAAIFLGACVPEKELRSPCACAEPTLIAPSDQGDIYETQTYS